jgi:hypothetical protein
MFETSCPFRFQSGWVTTQLSLGTDSEMHLVFKRFSLGLAFLAQPFWAMQKG